jgi:hypothetical protein
MSSEDEAQMRHWIDFANGAQCRNGARGGCAIDGEPLRVNPLMAHPTKGAIEASFGLNEWRDRGVK